MVENHKEGLASIHEQYFRDQEGQVYISLGVNKKGALVAILDQDVTQEYLREVPVKNIPKDASFILVNFEEPGPNGKPITSLEDIDQDTLLGALILGMNENTHLGFLIPEGKYQKHDIHADGWHD